MRSVWPPVCCVGLCRTLARPPMGWWREREGCGDTFLRVPETEIPPFLDFPGVSHFGLPQKMTLPGGAKCESSTLPILPPTTHRGALGGGEAIPPNFPLRFLPILDEKTSLFGWGAVDPPSSHVEPLRKWSSREGGVNPPKYLILLPGRWERLKMSPVG